MAAFGKKHLEILSEVEDLIRVNATCRQCGWDKSFKYPRSCFEQWQNGSLIQRVFPHMTVDDRELLTSGTCGSCFDDMFKEPEQEDELDSVGDYDLEEGGD